MSLYKVTVLVPATVPLEGLALGVEDLLAPYEIINAWNDHDPPAPPAAIPMGSRPSASSTAWSMGHPRRRVDMHSGVECHI
jgi:hypothetical protein